MLTFEEFILEKLHVNTEVKELTDFIFDKIKNYKKKWWSLKTNDKEEIKINLKDYPDLSKYIKTFRVIVDPDLKTLGLEKFEKDKKLATIFLRKDISKSTLGHELNHLYQDIAKLKSFNRAIEAGTTKKDYYEYSSSYISSKDSGDSNYLNKNIHDFLTLVYWASDEEINSRVVDFYYDIRDGMNIKETHPYEVSEHLMNSGLIPQKNPETIHTF